LYVTVALPILYARRTKQPGIEMKTLFIVTWTELGNAWLTAAVFEDYAEAEHYAAWRNEMAFASEIATVWEIV
jgi:hypothetical protein